jgi:ankyrin repeat protein
LKRIEELIDEVAGTKKWVFTDAETLKTLIQSGWDLGKFGQDYLSKAVNWKDAELVRILLAAGVNVNDPNKAAWPILFQAAARPGNAEVLKVLIQAGANVNITNNEVGTTALHLSAKSGDPEGLKVLIFAGAKLDAQTSYGGTALMEAVLAGRPENLRILLAAGASLALRNREARSALDYAEKWMQIDPERGGFDFNIKEHAATRLEMVNALKQAGAPK